MWNFQDTFETCEPSFFSFFSIYMTVPLIHGPLWVKFESFLKPTIKINSRNEMRKNKLFCKTDGLWWYNFFFLKGYHFYKQYGWHFLFFPDSSGLKPNLSKYEITGIGVLKGVQVAVCCMSCVDLKMIH